MDRHRTRMKPLLNRCIRPKGEEAFETTAGAPNQETPSTQQTKKKLRTGKVLLDIARYINGFVLSWDEMRIAWVLLRGGHIGQLAAFITKHGQRSGRGHRGGAVGMWDGG